MTYDELIQLLGGLEGRVVEATIRTPYDDPESGSGGEWFGGFSGTVGHLGDEQSCGPDHRTLYWREPERNRPHEGSITLWRRGYERTEVRSSGRTLEEALAEYEDALAEVESGIGSTWTVEIFQCGLLVELTIYI
jgi:hypothetical protein